ncbi:helix-turn-helix transcriptional regulator [Actinokineospora globicatena]|nr:helix-turn-helix transcriptional regulator [Actinokineospora globicatena]GLW86158.1 helix-turn-helix transcriptional regulator [Actinokineospora globicatena]
MGEGLRALPEGKVRIPNTSAVSAWAARLTGVLDECVAAAGSPPPVTVVHGPAGSGKTAALAAWANASARPAAPRVRWASLDPEDNVPARLWATIHSALVPSDNPAPCDSTDPFADLVRAVDSAPDNTCLVLDDVHELREPAVLQVLATLVRRPPDRLRLVLAGRTPPVHLSRLSLEGRLREVDGHALALTPAETAALLAEHGIDPDPADLAALLERTRGWVAGTLLAASWLAGQPEAERDPRAFPIGDPLAADYFAEEVLAEHPPHVRQVLLVTSVCDRVSGDLATALSGQRHTGTLLHRLARTNSLVTRCEDSAGEWYRYHPLLRDHLRAELARTRPGAPQRLHREAAHWLREEGDVPAAFGHAELAQDADLTAELVEAEGLREVLRGNSDRLYAAVAALPEDRLHAPAIALIAALAALEVADVPAADGFLARLAGADPTTWPARTRVLHEVALLRRAHLDGGGVVPPRAQTTVSAEPEVDVLIRFARGSAALWSGKPGPAESELSLLLQACLRADLPWAALHAKVHLAVTAALRGDLSEMERRARRALHVAEQHGWERSWACAPAYLLLAWQAHQQGDTAAARRYAKTSAELGPVRQEPTLALAQACLSAFIEFEEADDPHTVVRATHRLWQRHTAVRVSPQMIALLLPTLVRMTLRVGEQGRALELVDRCQPVLEGHAELPLLHAILHTHHGRATQARRLLAAVLTGRTRPLAAMTLVDAWLLEATLLERVDRKRAHEAVGGALRAAEPIGAIRPFLAARRSVRDLLAEGAGRFGRLERFAEAALSALPATAAAADPLTVREQELLLELPSMRTVDEIAESMFVSANTVKTHLRGIYRKLGVRQRRDAVVAARRQGLL